MGYKILILASEADLPITRAIETHLRPLVRDGLVESISWSPEPTEDETSFDALLRMGREAGMVIVVWSRHAAASEFFRDVFRPVLTRMMNERLLVVPVWADATEKPLMLSTRMGIPFTRDDPGSSLATEPSPNRLYAELATSIRHTLERESGRPPRPPTPWNR